MIILLCAGVSVGCLQGQQASFSEVALPMVLEEPGTPAREVVLSQAVWGREGSL